MPSGLAMILKPTTNKAFLNAQIFRECTHNLLNKFITHSGLSSCQGCQDFDHKYLYGKKNLIQKINFNFILKYFLKRLDNLTTFFIFYYTYWYICDYFLLKTVVNTGCQHYKFGCRYIRLDNPNLILWECHKNGF